MMVVETYPIHDLRGRLEAKLRMAIEDRDMMERLNLPVAVEIKNVRIGELEFVISELIAILERAYKSD